MLESRETVSDKSVNVSSIHRKVTVLESKLMKAKGNHTHTS